MNANQLINMFFRLFVRKLMNRGINSGLNAVTRGSTSREPRTPEERKQAKAAGQTAKRLRQSTKLGRRIGRM